MNRNLNIAALSLVLSLSTVNAAPEMGDQDKTLSPYFLIEGGERNVEQLPLLSTNTNVNIAGVIADVTVTQVYKNDGKVPIEAIYIFPASTRAAVYALRMTLDGRTIDAVVKERQQARIDYETARQEGKSASLLEQQRPNVFQMNVANILPGDTIKVELKYTELLVPEENVYEFVYPTVVGPRYSNKPESGAKSSDAWVQNPYLHQGQKPNYTFNINVGIQTGIPIQEMTCPTHATTVHYENSSSASLLLDKSETSGGNRDFILKYRLAGDQIESGMLLYKGEKENFFCMMVQPPQRVTSENIPPREYIFVVDVSGSMNGFPLEISKALMKKMISGLRPSDCFNVILFAGVSNILSEKSLPASPENIKKAIDIIDEQQGSGGTELLPALKRSLALPRSEAVSRSIIVVTDGYVDVETQAFDLIRKSLNNANLFAFGIGTSVNRRLIEGMARVGGGEPFIIISPDGAQEIAEKFRTYIQNPVLTQVKYQFNNFSVYDVEPISVPDVMASRPVIIYGKWKGTPAGTATITGYTGGRQYYEQVMDIKKSKTTTETSALRYLWARNRIAILDDYNNLQTDDSRIKEVTSLGLNYNLLTAYTSFVAIDNEIRNTKGSVTSVKQPLPLPQGVSDLAVGSGGRLYASAQNVSQPASPLKSGIAMAKRKSMSVSGGLVAMESLVEDKMQYLKTDAEKDERRETESTTVQLTDPANVVVSGKTLLYFWKCSMTASLGEIESIIKFAKKNADIRIVIVNVDTLNQRVVEQMVKQVTDKSSAPSNVTFVHDPSKQLMKYSQGTVFLEKKPAILFTNGGILQKSKNEHLNFWSDGARIVALFK